MEIRDIQDVDIVTITEIYNRYIEQTTITFEEVPISVSKMGERVNKIRAAGLPWLVVAHEGTVVGYAYAGQWNARSAYRFTVEPSIYLSPQAKGQGWGRAVYQVLLSKLKDLGIRNVLGVIALPNEASIGLHESLGFRKVGEFSQVGYKFDRWLSVGYWQLEIPLQ
ncbi:GNAT family N-acetyltransferase [Vibrio fluvialis]|uniref:GNAT family N-acetyltransferase n=1 Tax=Vibrio fluvialis TaxID=676 RepID=UPI0013028670|nr:GNAT family N-acetyltransferase [Vibrio fluvialis]